MKESLRINKYLQEAGLCSRRAADELIRAGRVTIDGKTAQLGTKVEPDSLVCVDGRPVLCEERERILIAVNKPVGIVCTEDSREKDNIIGFLHYPKRITYAGRLDKDSSGLLLLTNDGEMVNQMMRASSFHEKEYLCTVDKPITEAFVQSMRSGVKIRLDDDEHLKKNPHGVYVTTRPCRVKKTGERSFSIVLTQGYNRQIRRMSASCGYNVVSLKRTRLMHLTLGDLKAGQMRQLKGPEVMRLKEAVTGSPRSKTGSRKEAVFSGKTDTRQKKSGTKRDDKRRI